MRNAIFIGTWSLAMVLAGTTAGTALDVGGMWKSWKERHKHAGAADLEQNPMVAFQRRYLEEHPPRLRFQATDAAGAQEWKTKLRQALRSVACLDQLPPSVARPVRGVARFTEAEYVREVYKIETEPGLEVPFDVLLPLGMKKGERRATVLLLAGHGGGRADCYRPESYQGGNALELVRRGFIVALPEMRGFGELGRGCGWSDDPGHVADIRFNLRMGRTALGSFLHDALSVFDHVSARADVDADRLAVAGTSLGGTLAVWFAALEPRVKAVVASATLAGTTPGRVPMPKLSPLTEFDIPGLSRVAELQDIAAAAAPAALLIDADPTDQRGVEQSASYIRAAYEVQGVRDRVQLRTHGDGHTFSVNPDCEFLELWLQAPTPSRIP